VDAAVLSYRQLLEAEKARRRLFSEGVKPQFFSDPPETIHQRLEAVNRMREGKHAEARELLARLDEATPPVAGELNGKPFASLRDCDDLFAPVLEVLARGGYFWVPLAQIDSVAMNPPRYPRDLLWLPATLTLRDDQTGDVFLPVLYPGSHEHAEDAVKLGRMTDWKSTDDGPVLGVGARLFLTDDEEVGVLEWRQVKFHA
jgi:type VI secretion system protein ImpE